MIDDSRIRRGVALPGMSPTGASPGGRSLASFLDARATGRETATSPTAAAASFTPSSPRTTARATSPTRGYIEPAAAPTRHSPVRRSTSPSKPASPTKLSAPSAAPISVPRPGYERALSSSAEMKHAATSPIKFDEPGVKSITPNATPAGSPSPASAAMSPAFAQLQRANSSDRMPTASLTRLKGKGMVGQRLKEAKDREAASSDSASGSGSAIVPGRITIPRSQPQSPSKWGAVDTTSSPARSSTSPSSERKWQRSGNALPGLSRPTSSGTSNSNAFRSPSPVREAERNDAPPVRLPGMGGAASPFGASGGRAASPTKVASDDAGAEAKPLEHLTASRARGPAKRSARGGAASEPQSKAEAPEVLEGKPSAKEVVEPAAAPATTPATAPAPLRSTAGPRIAVLISGSGSNLQALIDATHLPSGPLAHAQISFVLSNRKAAYGLTRASTSNPPIPTEILALKTWQNRNPGGTREQYDEVLARAVLEGGKPDLIVLAGFMHIVSPVFLRALGHDTELPNSGAPAWRPSRPVPIINLHPALPHAFDGANAIPRAYEAFQRGEVDKTGIMVHEVVAEVDRGAPVLVREVPIRKGETLEGLEERMHSVEHELIVEATRVVLKRIEDGESVAQIPTPAKSRMVPLKRAGDSATFAKLSRNAQQLLARRSTPQSPNINTLSSEVILIQSDGSTSTLPPSDAHILHEGETQAIVHRFKPSRGAEEVQTRVYARAGAWSGYVREGESGREGRKLQELAKRYGAQVTDARQGKESEELAALFPGAILETRQGAKRSAWDKGDSMLFRVSCSGAATFVDQVELHASSLSSASSFVLSVAGTVLVWHGRGAFDSEREAARRFAENLTSGKVQEMEEGAEKGLWHDVLGRGSYAGAWHHRRRRAEALLSSTAPRLLLVRAGTGDLEEISGSWTPSEIPQAGVSLIVLSSDVYVLVGPDARGDRSEISVALQAAEHLKPRATHVLVYPSLTPCDLASSLRYWSSYEAGLVRGAKRMNVVNAKQAKRELEEWSEVDERLLADLKCLPVGIDETAVL